jgi:hypothetical protein
MIFPNGDDNSPSPQYQEENHELYDDYTYATPSVDGIANQMEEVCVAARTILWF